MSHTEKAAKMKIKCGEHTLTIFAPKNDATWSGHIAGLRKGEFSNLFDLKPKKDDIIMDIGCNLGLVGLFCAKLYPQCDVHAFDPCRTILSYLRMNCKLNNISNLRCYNVCVTASNKKKVKFSHETTGPSCWVQSSLTTKDQHEFFGGEVENLHIKDLLSREENIAYMKMDIEGSEHEIFNYLYKNQPEFHKKIKRVHIEVHGKRSKKKKLIKKLRLSFPDKKNHI